MKKPSICPSCSKRVFYNKKHECIPYEPVSMEEQKKADDIDNAFNDDFENRYMCNGQKYKLTYDELPKLLDLPETDSRLQSEDFQKSRYIYICKFCDSEIDEYQKENHQKSNKCKKYKEKHYNK